MPFKIFEQDNKFHMFMTNDAGEKVGESLYSFESIEEANAKLSSTPREEPKITLKEFKSGDRTKVSIVSESILSGGYPDVPLPPDINLAEIPETERVFVTLPIGKFNSESLNGHTYTEKAMRQMVDQINMNRPESNWGHIKDEDFGFRYNEPPVRWLAAKADDNGTIWGKCRALTPEAQRYYKNAKIDNARVGTSLFAWAEIDGSSVTGLDLISIDLADPARVGIPMTAAKPIVATEMSGEEQKDIKMESKEEQKKEEVEKEEEMDKVLELQVRQALGVSETANMTEAIQELRDKVQNGETQIAESNKKVTELQGRVTELETENRNMIRESMENMISARVKLPEVRELVQSILEGRSFDTYEKAKEAVENTLKLEFVKKAIGEKVESEMGDAQSRPDNRAEGQSGMAAYFVVPKSVEKGNS